MFEIRKKENRFTAKCVVVLDQPRVRKFVIDTGARFTCCSYDFIDPDLKEEDFSEARAKILGGFVTDVGMKFYECTLRQLTVGSVDLGSQKVWITFDERITDSLLGMDILGGILFANIPMSETLCLYNDIDDASKDVQRRATGTAV